MNANKSEEVVRKIVEWMKREINRAWESRETITPRYEGMPQPQVIQILKCLPRSSGSECGAPTCMVFATRMTEGIKGSSGCPVLAPAAKEELDTYMQPFSVGVEGLPW